VGRQAAWATAARPKRVEGVSDATRLLGREYRYSTDGQRPEGMGQLARASHVRSSLSMSFPALRFVPTTLVRCSSRTSPRIHTPHLTLSRTLRAIIICIHIWDYISHSIPLREHILPSNRPLPVIPLQATLLWQYSSQALLLARASAAVVH
jgi:hypothetical protein